jgi:hypothetical protein
MTDDRWIWKISLILCRVLRQVDRSSPDLEQLYRRMLPVIASPQHFDGHLMAAFLAKTRTAFGADEAEILAGLRVIAADVQELGSFQFSGICTILTEFVSAFPREIAANGVFQSVFQPIATAVARGELRPPTSSRPFVLLLQAMHRQFNIFANDAYVDLVLALFTSKGEFETVDAIAAVLVEILPELSVEVRMRFAMAVQDISTNPELFSWGEAMPPLVARLAELDGTIER